MAYLALSDGPVNFPKKMNPCMKTIIHWKTISVIILRGAKNPITIIRFNDIPLKIHEILWKCHDFYGFSMFLPFLGYF